MDEFMIKIKLVVGMHLNILCVVLKKSVFQTFHTIKALLKTQVVLLINRF